MLPEIRVPVMTVPKPFMVNTRSTGRRKIPPGFFDGDGLAVVVQGLNQLRYALAGNRRHGNDGRVFQKGAVYEFLRDLPGPVPPIPHSTMSILVQHNKSVPDAEKCADFKVFPGPGASRLHLLSMIMATTSMPVAPATMFFDEFFMPGHVDNADVNAAGKGQRGKTQLNGNAALFFFFSGGPVSYPLMALIRLVFAVINVAGSAQNNLL